MYGYAYRKPKLFNKKFLAAGTSVQFSSIAQSCLTLWDFMDSSIPEFPVHHQIPELAQSHVHQVSDANHLIILWLLLLILSSIFPGITVFWKSQNFESGGQSIGTSASASVLPMNIHYLFPLGWTGWISLQSKGLLRVFSNTTVQKYQFFSAQLSL